MTGGPRWRVDLMALAALLGVSGAALAGAGGVLRAAARLPRVVQPVGAIVAVELIHVSEAALWAVGCISGAPRA